MGIVEEFFIKLLEYMLIEFVVYIDFEGYDVYCGSLDVLRFVLVFLDVNKSF